MTRFYYSDATGNDLTHLMSTPMNYPQSRGSIERSASPLVLRKTHVAVDRTKFSAIVVTAETISLLK
ncbi:MAG: hypothetical protein WBA89_18180 [Microcoleus sp.]|uniref:hypothetical protein n=1 Tax=Microcoleus sp. TaxID=44472 RepID=UPI003C71F508